MNEQRNTRRTTSNKEYSYNYRRSRSNTRRSKEFAWTVAFFLLVIGVLLTAILLYVVFAPAATPETTSAAESTSPANSTESTEAVPVAESPAITDLEAPVISGVTDKTITIGEGISYMQGVTVTDNVDSDIELSVDNSNVDLNSPGEYTVIYTATDKAGNTATVSSTITVLEEETQNESEISQSQKYLNEECRKILKNTLLITDDMDDLEKLARIFDYVRYESAYKNEPSGNKSDWVKAAQSWIDGKHMMDCYGYFAISKAFVENAGFETIDVEKSDTSHSRHYWNLIKIDSGWYHFDASPREGDGDYFCMVTDEQLESYAIAFAKRNPERGRSHIWDKSLYPEVSKIVVSDLNTENDATPLYKLVKDPNNSKNEIMVSNRR